MNKTAINCDNIEISFENFKMERFNLSIKKGYVTGLIGANGSGKSTLIKCISGVFQLSSGVVSIDGLHWWDSYIEINEKLKVVYEEPNFETSIKADRLAKYISKLEDNFDMEFFQEKMKKYELKGDMQIQKYSTGMIKKYMLILAMARKPEILILDEPTSSVDPISRNQMLDMLQEFMEDENHTILFSTHITSDLDKIADYVLLLNRGLLIFNETKEKLVEMYSKNGENVSIEEIMLRTV